MRTERWIKAGSRPGFGAGPVAAASALGLALLLGASAHAAPLEGDGLNVPLNAAPWSRWQARVALGTAATDPPGALANRDGIGLKPRGLSVMGDYYFRPSLASAQPGGFRATSGLLIGARSSLSLADGTVHGTRSGGLSAGQRTAGLQLAQLPIGADTSTADASAVPYVGVGYSGTTSTKGGFGFSADLGLMALHPGAAVQLGRVANGTQSLNDMLRELRLSPVLQLGVTYSF